MSSNNNRTSAPSLFTSTAVIPPGTSVDALAMPILREAQFNLKRENIHRMHWSILKTVEFEIRFGQFMCLDQSQKTALFGQGGGRGRGGMGGRGGGGPVIAPTGLSANNQPTQRWTAKIGMMPQTTLLAPKSFQAKMNVPTKSLFERAKRIVEHASSSATSSEDETATNNFTFACTKKETHTCDYKFNKADVRVSMDLDTKQPGKVIDKRKLCVLDFGIALSPVDIRFAVSKEKPLDTNDEDREKQNKAVQFVLETYFGAEKKQQQEEQVVEEKKNENADDGADQPVVVEDPFTVDRCDKRKKDRISYTFTVTPKNNDSETETQQQQQNSEDPNHVVNQQFALMQKYFPIGGVVVDLTHVVMNDKFETLEAEFEWDIEAAVEALDQFISSSSSSENCSVPAEVLKLMKDVKNAIVSIDQQQQENNGEQTTTVKPRLTEEEQKQREEMYRLRLSFMRAGLAVVVKSAIGLAMSLKNENLPVTIGAIRQREE